MISGIGLDIVEMERIKKIMSRSDKFAKRILSEREFTYFEALSDTRKVEYLAGRFAAKEAYSKANGTGIGEDCEFQDIEVINNAQGKPNIFFKGKQSTGLVSITHTNLVAAAQVILLNDV